MENLLMIATLIEKLPHGDLKSMANTICAGMEDFPKTDWTKDERAMLDLIYDWAITQIEDANDDK